MPGSSIGNFGWTLSEYLNCAFEDNNHIDGNCLSQQDRRSGDWIRNKLCVYFYMINVKGYNHNDFCYPYLCMNLLSSRYWQPSAMSREIFNSSGTVISCENEDFLMNLLKAALAVNFISFFLLSKAYVHKNQTWYM